MRVRDSFYAESCTTYLGHLSKENNYAQLAYETVKLEIQLDPVEYMPQDFDIQVAERDCISGICNF